MTFISTWLAVAGLTAVSIPIVIHLLLRRRRQPIEWGAMRLLIEAVRRHRRRARLEQILLLTIRCLVVLLIGLALAEPVISGLRSLGGGSRLVVMVIDDGLASGIRNEDGAPELDRSIESAAELLDQLSPGDRVAVVTTSTPPRMLTDGPSVNLDGASRIIRNIRPSAARSDLDGALQVAGRILDEHSGSSPATISLFGSWRRGSLLEDGTGGDEGNATILGGDRPTRLLATLPTTEPTTTVVVSDLAVRRPVDEDRGEQPRVRISVLLRRMGSDLGAARSLVSLDGPGLETPPPRQVDWSPGRSEAVIEFVGRTRDVDAAIDGTSLITARVDDQILPDLSNRSILVDTSSGLNVGIIDRNVFTDGTAIEDVRSADWIERALEPDESGMIVVERIDPASLTSRVLGRLDAVVVTRPDLLGDVEWPLISAFVDRGGLVLLAPPGDASVHTWLDRLEPELGLAMDVSVEPVGSDPPEPLAPRQPGGSFLSLLGTELDELSTPIVVSRRLQVDSSRGEGRPLLVTETGDPILIAWEPRRSRHGVVALLTVSPRLDWTNLPIKPLMVPLLQELVREGTSTGRGSIEVAAGDLPTVTVSGSRELGGPGERSITIDQNGRVSEALVRNGHWIVRDSEGSALSTIVVNSEVAAGDPVTTTPDELTSRLGEEAGWELLEGSELAGRFRTEESNPLWSLILLGLALMLLVVETGLNRWFSRSRSDSASVRTGSLLGGTGS